MVRCSVARVLLLVCLVAPAWFMRPGVVVVLFGGSWFGCVAPPLILLLVVLAPGFSF